MSANRTVLHLCLFLGVSVAFTSPSTAQSAPATPETVLATFHVKPDQVSAFLKLMPPYWAALRAQGLVLAEPYLLLQGEEHGKPVFVQVFSWKDHDVADNVSPEIQQYWGKFNAMVESRDGHPGIEFPEMTIVK